MAHPLRLLLLRLLILTSWLYLVCADDSDDEGDKEHPPGGIVWRSDKRSPDEIKKSGGFLPKAAVQTNRFPLPSNNSLFNHVEGGPGGWAASNSAFVSTSARREIASGLIMTEPGGDRMTLHGTGYLYKIHVTPNFIDVDGSLGRHNPFPGESEWAAMGGIAWGQVISWTRYENYRRPQALQFPNPDYFPLNDFAGSGGSRPDLAGFPPDHEAWHQDPWAPFAGCFGSSTSTTEGSLEKRCPSRSEALMKQYPNPMRPVCRSGLIKKLKVGVKISRDLWSGTTDRIFVSIAWKFPATLLFQGPSAGSEEKVQVDLMTTFGKTPWQLKNLTITLIQEEGVHPVASDDMKLGGVSLAAECADGALITQLQYKTVEEWLSRPPALVDELTSVWSASFNLKKWRHDK